MKSQVRAKNRFLALFGFVALFVMAISVAAVGQNITGSEAIQGRNETRSDAAATGFVFEGGNITEMNFTIEKQTGWWIGVWGTINLNFTLEDATGNVFYNWGLANATGGELYFSNDSTLFWGDTQLVNTSPQNLTYAQTAYGWAASPSIDNLTSTYTTAHTHQAFSVTGGHSFTANNGPAVNLRTQNGLNFNATMLWQNASRADNVRIDYPVFAALVQPFMNSFKGPTAHYEVLLPTRADVGEETYFVYAELS